MGKHAYLIIAHNNFYVLEKTLKLIDDERNDIYIHIDKKVKGFNFSKYKDICKKSTVTFTKKRYNVRWGSSSQVKTEMLLFCEAYSKGYEYYHLISGADMPIKSQDYIHTFFKNNNYEFITSGNGDMYSNRIGRYHFYTTIPVLKKVYQYFDIVQNKMKIDRLKKKNLKIYKGSNWASISHKCVELLIQNRKKIIKMTRFSLCADELYKQTIIINSKFAKNLYPYDDIRLIDWERNEGFSPHTFTIDDYDLIINSPCIFARKFVKKKDRQIIDKVYDFVIKTQNGC